MAELQRYARITRKFPREFLLLQGRGCRWGRCTFCDYHRDVSADPFAVNAPVLERVTGESGVLDVINSGSTPELDDRTLDALTGIVHKKNIHTIWLETHYRYRDALPALARRFAPARVCFRCGVESFDAALRRRWRKGIPAHVDAPTLARDFQGVCLLACVQGQTREGILRDIALAATHFAYASVNVFCPNSTPVLRDAALHRWFTHEVYPTLRDHPTIEVLLENTALGVG